MMRILTTVLLSLAGLGAWIACAELPIQIDPPERPPGHLIAVPPPRTPDQPPPTTATATNQLPKGICQLTVMLSDGSRLLGQTKLKELPLVSEALGKLNVPLANIKELKLGKQQAATVTLHNGDRVQGRLELEKFDLQTSFGPVTVPVEHLTSLQVKVGG